MTRIHEPLAVGDLANVIGQFPGWPTGEQLAGKTGIVTEITDGAERPIQVRFDHIQMPVSFAVEEVINETAQRQFNAAKTAAQHRAYLQTKQSETIEADRRVWDHAFAKAINYLVDIDVDVVTAVQTAEAMTIDLLGVRPSL